MYYLQLKNWSIKCLGTVTFETIYDCAESFFPNSHLFRFIILCSLQTRSSHISIMHTEQCHLNNTVQLSLTCDCANLTNLEIWTI